MKYVKQFLIIIGISLAGEILKYILPLPIPASIYGMAILFIALLAGIIKLKDVRETGKFLIEIMPLMFIPAGVGLMSSWGSVKASSCTSQCYNSCFTCCSYGSRRSCVTGSYQNYNKEKWREL